MNKVTDNLFFGSIDLAIAYKKEAVIIYYGTRNIKGIKKLYINTRLDYHELCEQCISIVLSTNRINQWMKHRPIIIACDDGKYISGIVIIILLIKYAIKDNITYKDIDKIEKRWIRRRIHDRYTKSKKIMELIGVHTNEMCIKLVIFALINELNVKKMNESIDEYKHNNNIK